MDYDSVLSQQSISGKIVSLILCVETRFFQILSHDYVAGSVKRGLITFPNSTLVNHISSGF